MRVHRSYQKYMPSGVEWLGDVPEHWEIWKVAHGFELIGSGTTPPSDEYGWYDGAIPWITTSELRENTITTTEKSVTDDAVVTFSALKKFPKGSLAIAMYGATIGRLGILGIEATTNQACCVMSGGNVFTVPFVYYWMQAFKKSIILLASGGGQPNISQDKIKSLKIPCPQIPEQQTIAVFLDHETGRIDTLVAKKERLIELLREKRSALISRTVTKGLDPSVKMKPSGVEWLGDVPKHWEVQRLKYSARSITGFAFSSDDYMDNGVPLIRIGDILENGSVDIANAKKLPPEYMETHHFVRVTNGDILMAMTGATIGKAGRYTNNEPGLLNQRVCKFVAVLMHQDFLWYILKTIQYEEYIRLTGFGGAQPNISDKQLLEFTALLPPLPEQQAIAAFLDREMGKFDALIAKVEAAIAKLKEYRTALISAAVTGKIDVREVV